MSPEPTPREASEARAAWAAAIGCYLIWGFLPLFLQAVYGTGASAWEILAHRIVWSVPVAAVFVLMARQWPEVACVLRQPRTLALLAVSALLIAGNWATFIVAVNDGRVVETSLGYYITPLINMAAGALIFRETLTRAGLAAIGLAVAAWCCRRSRWATCPMSR
jgi:chloramphenicol-sensitive protein RarD